MSTDNSIQNLDANGQTLVTSAERQALIQHLSAKWPINVATKVENMTYEKSRGIKNAYYKLAQGYMQQLHAKQVQQSQALAQQAAAAAASVNPIANQYPNPSMSYSSNSSTSISNASSHSINPLMNSQVRFSNVQPTRMPISTTAILNNQPSLLNQNLRLREPQRFSQPVNTNYASTTANATSQMVTNATLNDYLSSTSTNRFANPSMNTPRPRMSTITPNLNVNLPSQGNPNDILQQLVVGNPPPSAAAAAAAAASIATTTSAASTSASGDRLLQQILSDSSGIANKMSIQNRALTTPMMPTQIRPTTSANMSTLRTTLSAQQASTPPSLLSMQPSPNMSIQQSPLNPNTNSSTPIASNHPSPINRPVLSAGSANVSSPDDEITSLVKYLKENLIRIQSYYQKFTNEKNIEKARHAQQIHQQMVHFITNPTMENIANARHIRDLLERSMNRQLQQQQQQQQQLQPNPTVPPVNELEQFEKVLQTFVSQPSKKSLIVNKIFIEPLCDVINGVPHKKFRLDDDHQTNQIKEKPVPPVQHSSSLLVTLHNEIDSSLTTRFSIEYLPVSHTTKAIQLDDEYLSKNGLVLRCKLLELTNPIVPPLRLRISTRYPDDQPEILSLTKSMPPKLEYSDGHPLFEQLSTIFASQLFKLSPQHTITDILHIWYQSVQMAL